MNQTSMNLRKFLWIAGTLLTVVLVLFLILRHNLNSVRQEENALRTTLNRMEEENKTMDAELSVVGTEDYIVNSAMTNYAFINKNDIRFRFTNPDALYAYTEEELKILMAEMAD